MLMPRALALHKQTFYAISFMSNGLGRASSLLPDFRKAATATDRIFKLIDTKSEIDPTSTEGSQREMPAAVPIEVEKATFAYPTRKAAKVFDNLR